MMTFSKTDNSLTVIVVENGRHQMYSTTSAHPRWNDILQALKHDNQDEIVQLMSVKNLVERYTESNVEIDGINGNVYFKGRPLHGFDVDRLLEFVREGVPFLPLARFLERKQKNPSFRSITELYKFLEHRKMPLTPNGTVLGYKGVQNDFYSVMGNTATVMIVGGTDSSGHILNTVGSRIRCDRNCVCDDYRQGCSPGLHIGSLEYALSWGQQVVIVEFDPADVVCVPEDCECQKLRACAYEVKDVYTVPMVDTYSDKYELNSKPDEDNDEGYDEDNDEGYDTCGKNCSCHQNTDENDPIVDFPFTLSYNKDGFEMGMKDGKAHKVRKHYITDLDDATLSPQEKSYIKGYNDGYKSGRYNK